MLEPLPFDHPEPELEETTEEPVEESGSVPADAIEQTTEEKETVAEAPMEGIEESKVTLTKTEPAKKVKTKPVRPPKTKDATEKPKPEDDEPKQMSLFD
jgi:hypothetical protein